jgi:predicted transglutaminase-like cysteine proteinase
MNVSHLSEPRFLDVLSFSVFRALSWLRRFGIIIAAFLLTALLLFYIIELIASSNRKAQELPPIFNSVGISMSHSPFDAKFRRAAVAGSGPKWNEIVTRARVIGDPLARVEFVHQAVVGYVQYAEDRQIYGVDDRWATPGETLSRRRGDCEDFAILEMMLLQAVGISRSDIYLTVGADLVVRRDHALLTVEVGDQLWTLDQRTSSIYRTASVTDFRPIMTLSGNRVWLHGFKKRPETRLAGSGGGRGY